LLVAALLSVNVSGLPSQARRLATAGLGADAHLFDAEGMLDIPITRLTTESHHQFERREFPLRAIGNDDSKIDSSVVMMVNHKTTQYVAPFYIGTPPEKFTLILDTGSSNMWVYGSACHTDVCTAHKRFDHRKSSTWSKNGTGIMIKYGSGKIEGILSTDSVYFEDCTGKSDGCHMITKQQFGEVEYTEGKAFQWGKYDGIVGLGFPKLAIDGTIPPFDNLFYQNKLKNPVFSFFMTPKAGQEGSIFSVGGIKSNLYTGDLRWHSLFVTDKTPEYWTIKLTDVLIDGKPLGICKPFGCPFAVDTGTSLITGPSHMINRVISKLDVDEGCYRMKSGQLPQLGFQIDDTIYNLEAEDYVMKVQEDGTDVCIGGLRDLDLPPEKGPMWIAGDVFLRKYYSVYDRNDLRVGLARAAPVESVMAGYKKAQ